MEKKEEKIIVYAKDYSDQLYALCDKAYADTVALLKEHCPDAMTNEGEKLVNTYTLVVRTFEDMPEQIGAVRLNSVGDIEYLFAFDMESEGDQLEFSWMDDLKVYNPTDIIDLYYAVIEHINKKANL